VADPSPSPYLPADVVRPWPDGAPAPAGTSQATDGPVQGRDDRTDLLLAWGAGADAVDDLALARSLWDQSGAPAERLVLNRSLALLLSGEPAEGLRVLADGGFDDVPADGPRCLEHVNALACQAALGDPAAFSRLLGCGASVPPAGRGAYTYALALAAERLGHLTVADEAWRALAIDHRAETPLVLSRFVGGWVASRRPEDGVTRAMQGAAIIRSATPRPWHDPVVLERAIDVLQRRGDPAGAAMLAAGVQRTSPSSTALGDVVARVRPHVRRAAMVVPYSVAAVLCLAGLPGMVMAFCLVMVSHQYWRVVPELSREDEKAWRGIEQLRFDQRHDRAADGRTQVRGLVVLGALLGLVAGVTLAAAVTDLTDGSQSDAALLLQLGAWLLGLVGLPVLGAFGGQRILRVRGVRALRAREAAEDRARLADASACRCWGTVAFTGLVAGAYAQTHLHPVGDVAPPVAPAGRSAGTVLVCPLSGIRWLATATESGRSALLLRGTPPAAVAPAPAVPGTGGYL